MRRRTLRARYDAAATTTDNRRHWANADGLSANAANSPDVRCTLRNRARYEVANNSYARGIVLTLANDVVGTGPRLQMLTSDAEANRVVETGVRQVVGGGESAGEAPHDANGASQRWRGVCHPDQQRGFAVTHQSRLATGRSGAGVHARSVATINSTPSMGSCSTLSVIP